MNIEEIDNKIKELYKEIGNLELEKNIRKRWRADYEGTYFCVDIFEYDDYYSSFDDTKYNMGNYFKTENEAVEYKDKLIIYQKLKDLALDLNQGEQIDFDNEKQKKYIIVLDINIGLMIANIVHQQSLGQIYCLDESFLEKAKERIGEDKLKKLFE